MSNILLTTATRVQLVREGWLLVDNGFPLPLVVRAAQTTRIRVTLKRPDGSSQTAVAAITRPLEVTDREAGYFCLLKNLEETSVPEGTELWLNALDFKEK